MVSLGFFLTGGSDGQSASIFTQVIGKIQLLMDVEMKLFDTWDLGFQDSNAMLNLYHALNL